MKKVYNGLSKKGGIYKIYNFANSKFYIGSAKCFKTRVIQHLSSLRNNKHSNKILQNDFNKYGEEKFEFSVLEAVDGNKAKRLAAEQKYLDRHYDNQKYCYNILKEAQSPEGTFPKDTKRRKLQRAKAFKKTWENNKIEMVDNLKNRWADPDFKKEMIAIMKTQAKTPKRKKQLKKARQASLEKRIKEYHLISPDGIEYKGKNICKFCEAHDLDFRQISDIVKGRRRIANGWKTYENREPKYKLISPSGQAVKFEFMTEFSQTYNLSYHQISKLLNGKIKSHKGWRLL